MCRCVDFRSLHRYASACAVVYVIHDELLDHPDVQYWFSGRNQKVMQPFLSVSIKCVYSLSENAHHSTETEFTSPFGI